MPQVTNSRTTTTAGAAPPAPDHRPTGDELRRLVRAARSGDTDAETRLFRCHQRLLLGIARNHGLDEHDCADVAQRTWLKAREALPGLRSDDRFKQWIATIARNEAIRTIRHHSRETSRPTDEMDGEVVWDPDADLIASEAASTLRQALTRLGADDRRLIRLLFVEQKSYRQTAAELGCSTGCIGPNRGRMLDRLRGLLDQPDLVAA